MSLPKRDGVNDRYYLIHKPDTSPEVLAAAADLCEDKGPKFRAIAWQSLLWAIWGKDSQNGGSKVIKTAQRS